MENLKNCPYKFSLFVLPSFYLDEPEQRIVKKFITFEAFH